MKSLCVLQNSILAPPTRDSDLTSSVRHQAVSGELQLSQEMVITTTETYSALSSSSWPPSFLPLVTPALFRPSQAEL